jgi:curved DNA-binding protein CbpA
MNGLHTHYDNLKVARNAPPEVIRAAYKILCQQFHPDRHGGQLRATRTFQLINAAYDVLSDPARRQQHDEWIAKMEARNRVRDRVHDAERKPQRWNGRERRRKPWPQAAVSGASRLRPLSQSASVMTQRIPLHWRVLALWSSVALTGAVLILIYHL